VPNTWFETIVETNDEWIRDRTGIEARHFADEGTDTSDLAVEAATVPPMNCVFHPGWAAVSAREAPTKKRIRPMTVDDR